MLRPVSAGPRGNLMAVQEVLFDQQAWIASALVLLAMWFYFALRMPFLP